MTIRGRHPLRAKSTIVLTPRYRNPPRRPSKVSRRRATDAKSRGFTTEETLYNLTKCRERITGRSIFIVVLRRDAFAGCGNGVGHQLAFGIERFLSAGSQGRRRAGDAFRPPGPCLAPVDTFAPAAPRTSPHCRRRRINISGRNTKATSSATSVRRRARVPHCNRYAERWRRTLSRRDSEAGRVRILSGCGRFARQQNEESTAPKKRQVTCSIIGKQGRAEVSN